MAVGELPRAIAVVAAELVRRSSVKRSLDAEFSDCDTNLSPGQPQLSFLVGTRGYINLVQTRSFWTSNWGVKCMTSLARTIVGHS